MKKILKLTALSISIATAANFAYADTTTNITLDKITVSGSASKTGSLKFYSPTSSTTLQTSDAQNIGTNQLDASLRYTPGVQAQLYGGDLDDSLWFKVRGFDASIFVDGAPVFKDGYTWYSPVLFGYETAEVAKGANSVLFGASEAGGAVNLVTKRPQLQEKGLLQFNVGNRGQRGLALDYNGNYNNTLLYRIVASYDHQKGETYRTWAEQYYFAPSVTWLIDDKSSLTVLASVQKSTGVPTTNFYPFVGTVDTSSYEVSRRTNLGNPDADFFQRKAESFAIEYKRELGLGWDISAKYSYLQSKRDQLASYYSWLDSGTNYYRGYLYNDTTQRNHNVDVHVTNVAKVGGGTNTLALGAQYNYVKVTGVYGFGTYSGTYDLLAPTYTSAPTGYANQNPYLVNQHQSSLYLQDTFDWNNFIFDLGLRYDKVSSQSYTLGTNGAYETNRTTYSAGVMYNFDFGLSPFIHYSTSFKPVAGSDGQTAYKPITATQLEYGIKYVPEAIDARFTLTLFNIQEDNSLVQTATVAQQLAKNTSKGVELSADVNLTKNFNALLSYTYMDAKTRNGTALVRTPLTAFNQATARFTYSLDSIPLTLGAGARYFGESSDELGNPGKTIPSYVVADLLAKYSFTRNLDLLVTVTNLTNKTYVTGCYYSCYYGEGRKVNATLSYSW